MALQKLTEIKTAEGIQIIPVETYNKYMEILKAVIKICIKKILNVDQIVSFMKVSITRVVYYSVLIRLPATYVFLSSDLKRMDPEKKSSILRSFFEAKSTRRLFLQ